MSSQLADEIHPDKSRDKIHSSSSLSDKIDSTEKIYLTLKICIATLDYFYIYVLLDLAKTATVARLTPSPDVIKHDNSHRLNVERKITMMKTARFRSRARQPKSFTCIKFHSATTRREEKNYRGSWKKNWMFSCQLATTQNHPKKCTRPPSIASRIRRNQSACVI